MFFFRRDQRPKSKSLSTNIDAYYAEAYSKIAESGAFGLVSVMQHRQMEASEFLYGNFGQRVLEVGAGSGQHVTFVDPESWVEYIQTDQRPPESTAELLGTWIATPVNADTLPFADQSFDRLFRLVCSHTQMNQKRRSGSGAG